jgi:Tfp pilus assembly protein PilF
MSANWAVLAVAVALALGACSSEPVRAIQARVEGLFERPKGEAALETGLRQYEDGRYAESARSLQSALDLGLSAAGEVNARKHLAFMHCAAGRERACRDEFRKALAIDPALELAPEEAGHPRWGPVFRSVKAGR